MAVPTLYRWDDGNAPVSSGTKGALINLLTKCLVDGYGDKPAAGWTREFANVEQTIAAFRNNPLTGTGFFLQVDEANASYDYSANLQAYEVMTAETDGTLPFNTSGNASFLYKSYQVSTTSRPWVLIADDRSFYLFIWYSVTGSPLDSSNLVSNMFFGDFISRHQEDAFACALLGSYSNQYSGLGATQGPSLAAPAYTRFYLARSSGAAPGGVSAWHVFAGGPTLDSRPSYTGLPYTAGDQLVLTRSYLSDGGGYTFRGWTPGYFNPCHALPFGQLATITAEGKTMLSIRHCVQSSNYLTNALISLDDWWA